MSDEYALLRQRIRDEAYRLWEEAGRPEGQADRFWHAAKVAVDQAEAKLDKEVSQSFPASDPPSSSVVTGPTGDAPAITGQDDPTIRTPPAPAAVQQQRRRAG
jgi:hypothetical protein